MAKESDDDFCSPKPPQTLLAAPKRPEKKGSVQSVPVIPVQSSSICTESHQLNEGTSSHTDKFEAKDICAVCSKNISHLDSVRKSAHVNKCLDAQESSHMYMKAKEKWNNFIDCPMCGEPQPPGPHQSAHAKRCGKAYNIAPKELLRLMETQRRVRDSKKQHNMAHTKAPAPVKKEVVPPKLKGAPNSSLEENLQLAKALSFSMISKPEDGDGNSSQQFTRVFDPNEKKRKRPRSYAVVELAPRSCKCEIVQKIHERFLEAFRVRKTNGTVLSHAEICEQMASRTADLMQHQTRILEKLERLERLSQDIYRLVGDESLTDIRIQCVDGSVNAHRCLLHARTSLVGKPYQASSQSVKINESQEIVTYWLQYVYSGRVEWEKDCTERIQKIAEQYGPDGLLALCTRMLTLSNSKSPTIRAPAEKESHTVPSCATNAEISLSPAEPVNQSSSVSESKTNQCPSNVIIPNELTVELNSSPAVDKSDTTVDYEDPLQGLSLADTSEEHEVEADDDSVIIDCNSGRGRDNAEDFHALESSSKHSGEIIDLASPRNAVPCESSAGDMEITLIDLPIEWDCSEGRANGDSPDIFEEKGHSCSSNASEPTRNETPLRRSSRLRSDISTSRISLNDRLSSSSLHRSAVLGTEDVQELNKLSEASTKQPMAIQSENDKKEVCNAEIVCLDDTSEQNEKPSSADPYEDEYFNYHDPFVEQWYEPVDEIATQQVTSNIKRPQQSPEDRSERCETETVRPSSTRNFPRSMSVSPLHAVVPVEDRVNVDELPATAASQDSFFDTPKFFNNDKRDLVDPICLADNNYSVELAPPAAHSTPCQPAKKKARFGSNVKILKTTNITPMPDYEAMSDECLKRELAKFGLKAMGRKRAIVILKKIYAETHPEIDPSTPTIRPLVVKDAGDDVDSTPKSKCPKSRYRGQAIRIPREAMKVVDLPSSPLNSAQAKDVENNEDEDFVDLGDKTLNDSTEEPPEESMIDDVGILPKDLEGMRRTFLAWLRCPENDELYNHLLSLQPVLLDELHLRMTRADTAVCCIPKKALANILDRLGVTFSLPQNGGGRRTGAPRKRK